MRKSIYLLFAAIAAAGAAQAQVSLTNAANTYTQDFNGIGTTTTLPTDWRVDSNTTSPTWTQGKTGLNLAVNSGAPNTGGTYNFGTTAGTDRAVGAMSSGNVNAGGPFQFMSFFKNSGNSNITDLTISYTGERYRRNSAPASIEFYYSLNGTSWTAVLSGDIAASAFPTGTSTYYFSSPLTVSKTAQISGLNIAPNSNFYLRWTINETGSNSQGVGIDDVSVTATFVTPCTLNTWTGSSNGDWFTTGNWSCGTIPTATTDVYIPTGAANMPEITATGAVANKLRVDSGATITVATGGALTTNDTITIRNAGNLNGTGNFDFKGVITNSGIFNPTGTVTFSGLDTQRIPGIVGASNVTINNAKAVVMTGAVTTQTLTFSNGVLVTGTNLLTVNAPTNNAITNFSANSYVDGKIVRANMQAAGNYNFPVGSNGNFLPVRLNLQNATPSGNIPSYSVQAFNGRFATTLAYNGSATSGLTSIDSNSYWTINRVAGSATDPIDVTLPYSASRGVIDYNSLVVAHYNAANWEALPNSTPTGNATSGTVTATGVTSFSPFTIGATNLQPLPVQLVRFDLSQTATAANLRWELAQVAAGEKISLERSANGSEYVTLTTRTLTGTESAVQSYTDNQPLNGTGFYRLKMQQNDGRIVYSNALKAVFGSKAAVAVYPNPVSNVLHVDVPSVTEAGSIAIYNLSGVQVYSQAVHAAGSYTVDMQRLPAGLYQVKMVSASGVNTFRVQNLR